VTPVYDVAVTSVQPPSSPVLTGATRTVVVNVANQGTQPETFNVSLTDPSATISVPQSTTLGAGASSSLNFDWTPSVTGTHVLTGTATIVSGETDTADNSASAQVTVQDPSTATTTHVGDLDRTSVGSGGTWTANVTITIHDNSHGLVSNATVNGSWSGGTTGTASCTTNGNGQCTVSKSVAKRISSVTFSVTNVIHAPDTYNSSGNHDPDGDSNGTSIVVSKP
jgi:hypothetical protein